MTSVQTACFVVCLLQYLYNGAGHLFNTRKRRMMNESLIFVGPVHTFFFSENKTIPIKTPLSEATCLLPRIMGLFEETFRM